MRKAFRTIQSIPFTVSLLVVILFSSNSSGLLFYRLIEQAVNIAPVSYNEIINQNHG
jgi:hypothetical protein